MTQLIRLTTSAYGDYSVIASYIYDEPMDSYGTGRLTTMIDSTSIAMYMHDRRGALIRESKWIGGDTFAVEYAFDKDGNLKQIHYPSGRIIDYTVDYAGRPRTLTDTPPVWLPWSTVECIITDATYYPFEPLRTVTYGNGAQQSRSHDLKYDPLRWQVSIPPLGLVVDQTLTSDAEGNISAITDAVDALRNEIFTYDALYRLKHAENAGGYGVLDWTYDAIGNRLVETKDGVGRYSYQYMQNGSSKNTPKYQTIQYGASPPTSIQYDARGNQLNNIEPSWNYQYDDQNRLIVQGGGSSWSYYDYDGNGYRVSAYMAWPWVRYFVNREGMVLSSLVAPVLNMAPTDFIYFGSELVAQHQIDPYGELPQVTTLVFANHIGYPMLSADWYDVSKIMRGYHEPFGTLYASPGTGPQFPPHRYPGQIQDWDFIPTFYNVHRWYQPKHGRYTSPDPLGENADISPNAKANNTYSYAYMNPTNYFDEQGLSVTLWCRPLKYLSSAGHCYVRITCPQQGLSPTSIGLYPDATNRIAYIYENHNDDKGGDQYLIKPNKENKCCEFENCIREYYLPLLAVIPVNYHSLVNNSNSFAFTMIKKCGGAIPNIQNAPGSDFPWHKY